MRPRKHRMPELVSTIAREKKKRLDKFPEKTEILEADSRTISNIEDIERRGTCSE